MIDIGQTLSFIYRHEDLIDASDLPREQKKVVRAELQKSIDENLKALKSIRDGIFMRDMSLSMPMLSVFESAFKFQEILNNKNNI